MTGANAPQGCASQESFSGEGIVSGGQSVDLQSQTYDATWKTVAENARTHSSFDAGVDHLPLNSPLTTHASQKSQQSLLPPSSLATLQPYEENREFAVTNNKMKNNRQRKNKQKKIKRLLLINNSNQENHHFTKFYSVKFPRLDLDTKLNVIATDKDLKTKIGNLAMIKKQNKDTHLIEVKSDAQGNKLKSITALHDRPVEVTEHKTLQGYCVQRNDVEQ